MRRLGSARFDGEWAHVDVPQAGLVLVVARSWVPDRVSCVLRLFAQPPSSAQAQASRQLKQVVFERAFRLVRPWPLVRARLLACALACMLVASLALLLLSTPSLQTCNDSRNWFSRARRWR